MKVFLSYGRSTRPAVSAVAEALMLDGYDVWWDDELPVHRDYTSVIGEQISACVAVVVVWSPAAAESDWVRSEAELGRQQHKLVQILIEDAAVPMPFGQLQYADLRGWHGDRNHPQWRKVTDSLAALAAKPLAREGQDARAVRARFRAEHWHSLVRPVALGVGALAIVAAALVLSLHPFRAAGSPSSRVSASPTDCLIFPDSDRRLLASDDLKSLTKDQMRIARNEIYARHGYQFESRDLQQHFGKCGWYHPVGNYVELSSIEATNVDTIRRAEIAK
jgi:hypothetical protein